MITPNELFSKEKSVADYMLGYIIEQDRKIEEIKNLNIKERQFVIFKMFYNGLSESDKSFLQAAIKKYPLILNKIFSQIDDANVAHYLKQISLYNKEEVGSEIMILYKSLLQKISRLAKELAINNSLELSILFSYLLWNGYLSKNMEYSFNDDNLKRIPGLYFTDIMDGSGVCLNNSDMLKDFLNLNGYNSVAIQNHFNYQSKVNYKIDIKRNNNQIESKEKLLKRILKKNANHVFNLIEDNGKLYIYDSTNLELHGIINCNKSTLINGNGDFKLFPYGSYMLCSSTQEVELLDKLITTNNYSFPYTKEDLISFSEINLEILRSSRQLLDDFYIDAKRDIFGISEETAKIMKKVK